MRLGAIAFLCGILLFQQLAELPQVSFTELVLWVVLLLLAIGSAYFLAPLRPLLFAVAGFHWALLQASLLLASGLPAAVEREDLLIQGAIASIPQQQGRRWRFLFDVDKIQHNGQPLDESPQRVRINWYGSAPALNAGDRWQLTVRLKKPHGFMNPAGFDYEGWLFQQRIGATGYVRSSADNRLLSSDRLSYPVQRMRQSLAEAITAQLEQPDFKGIVMALAIGERQAITQPQWEVLRKSGTIHLVAISGLHIGLVAGMAFFLVQWLWPRIASATLRWPAPRVAAVAGLLAATFYATLAGFTIPTQRTLVMVAIVMLMLLLQRQRRFSDTIALALMIVLVIDPFVVMSTGFWLSFAAVAAIIFAMSGRMNHRAATSRVHDLWWRWGRVHLIVAVALLPLLLMTFQQLPLLSPVANFIAVPWVSFCVVPLVLLGTAMTLLLPDVGAMLLNAASSALGWIWPLLDSLAAQPQGLWQQHLPASWTLLPAFIGILLLLSPRGVPGRWLGILWLLPLSLITPQRPADGEWWFTLLDVGQGLAAVVQTHNHTLVYDTGPRYSSSFDTGSAVVVPFLNSIGIDKLEMLIIGHGDNDHMGGARSVIEGIEVKQIITSVPQKISWQRGAQRCVKGQQWQWDGVLFEIVHPSSDRFKGNDGSCVLRVSSLNGADKKRASLILSGDIEAAAEHALLSESQDKLPARVVVVPHHGSKSSSSAPFVAAVSPQYALFPVGHLNRYGFPHALVTERYQQQGAEMLQTATAGAITVHFDSDGEITRVQRFRDLNRRYWHAE